MYKSSNESFFFFNFPYFYLSVDPSLAVEDKSIFTQSALFTLQTESSRYKQIGFWFLYLLTFGLGAIYIFRVVCGKLFTCVDPVSKGVPQKLLLRFFSVKDKNCAFGALF